MDLNKYIDHTLLKPTAPISDIKKLCEEAIQYNFFSVCVNGSNVSFCSDFLKDTPVKVCSVVGFPLGAMSTASKLYETENAILNGADEIDTVINLGWIKDGMHDTVLNELTALKKQVAHRVLKVIIETCYLTENEKLNATKLVLDSGADFVKTSTGFGSGGATLEDVLLMKSVVGNTVKIKASGGIRDYETAKKYIDLGVQRLGTSNGVVIVGGTATSQTY